MADNRVVIKINYDKDKHRKEVIDPKMVTVWHTGRILAAVSILALAVITLLFWWPGEEGSNNHANTSLDGAVIENNLSKPEAPAIAADSKTALSQSPQESGNNNPQRLISIGKPEAIILDKRVIRASLNISIKDKEPNQPVIAAINIDAGKTQQLFYFNQIKNMKDKALFHHWFKDGQIVSKRQLDIKDDKSKLISSRTFGLKDVGDWRVVLVDRKGRLFCAIRFKVSY